MLARELEYDLPRELIAQRPAVPRDSSRLLVYDRAASTTRHFRFTDLVSFMRPGDLVAYNDSRVFKARIYVTRSTGGRVELLFLTRRKQRVWEVLARPSSRLRPGERLEPDGGRSAPAGRPPAAATAGKPLLLLKESLGGGRWLLENAGSLGTEELMQESGEMPLPPYITEKPGRPERYQTVYAREPGSAAAPTAGLHFTKSLMDGIKAAGARLEPLTLHIGLGTFRPVSAESLAGHRMHAESYSLPRRTYEALQETRKSGGRVIAVGTTTVRVLETVCADPPGPLAGATDLFIVPGFRFRAVDALVTNFHLPRSTLLALVMAFAGARETRRLYREAVRERYRFYSFGDAMLLL